MTVKEGSKKYSKIYDYGEDTETTTIAMRHCSIAIRVYLTTPPL